MRFLKSTVYKRIMAVFISAMILLYTFSIIMYERSVNSLKKQLTQSVYLTESNYIESLEQNVMKLKDITFSSALKQDWALLSTKRGDINNYETLQVVLYAQERLQAIVNSSFIVNDVKAHIGGWGRTISAKSGLMDLKVDEFNNVRMPVDSSGAQFVYYDKGLYLTSAYKYKYPVTFSIVIKLDMEQIAMSLSKLNILNKSYAILAETDTGQILAASSNDNIPEDVIKAIRSTKNQYGNFTFNINKIKYICVYDSSSYLGFTVVNLTPASELYKSLSKYYIFLELFSALVILIITSYIYYTYKAVGKPMLILINAFKRMEKGDFGVRVKTNANDDFAYLYNSFDHMAGNIQYLVDEVYQKEILVQSANLKQLQAQINPHFLYNSFYILHRMIKLGDTENAELFSSYLGKYFKYVTRNGMDEVSLTTEVEHARTYSEIMAIRMGNIVKIEFGSIPEKFTELIVPRLILQPLLENAFEHGIKGLLKEGHIQVGFKQEGDNLIIIVEDNGPGLSDEELKGLNERIHSARINDEVTGIINIHRRIQLMYGEDYGLSISSGEFEGTRISLRLGSTRRMVDK